MSRVKQGLTEESYTPEELEFVRIYRRPSISGNGGLYVKPISTNGYVESVKEAVRWVKEVNGNKERTHDVKVTGFYLQILGENSLLLFYNLTPINGEKNVQ